MQISDLSDRISRLERSNRRLKRWLLVLTLAFFVVVLFNPFAIISNPFGRQSIALSSLSGSAVQAFTNGENQRRLELGVVKVGEPVLYLLDRAGQVRLALDMHPEPNLVFRDQTGAARIRMSLQEDGSPRLSLTDSSGKAGVFLGTLADGTPAIRLLDREGNVMFQATDVEAP